MSNQPLNLEELTTLTRAQITSNFTTSGKKGKEGATYVTSCQDGTNYAIKLFKKRKSINKLKKEVELQQKAAQLGISPKVLLILRKNTLLWKN